MDKRIGWTGSEDKYMALDEDRYLDDLDALEPDDDHCPECGAELVPVGPQERGCVPCSIKEVR